MITFGMACLLLIGSVVFPLGDFSLTRDLPEMYRNYSKITTSDELSVFDFIGDYLLHGKEIFGHNANDKPQSAGNNVQFQHQPVPFFVVLSSVHLCMPTICPDIIAHTQICIAVNTSDFKNKLFRPPLA
ncbi:hypothetical protein [Mucilaginibacter sp.]|uniref:hypothetical protein n=1 Tax=Mucilaginibacter sp. TaxID=1882438 RepID=UPI002620E11E|nr:hypothetical protein [Mucilaginibacter sp.]MDB4924035.1 hypothetical protein [Mucilaginibacter sp.]